jgi:phosphonate dehydrogenase
MHPKIVVTNWVHPEVEAFLSLHGSVEANATRKPWPRAEVLRHAADADAILAFMTDWIDDTFLAACPRLKVIGCALKGYDNFDAAACAERGVWLTIVPDLLTAPTAELAVGLTIALGRRLLEGDAHIRSGQFQGWQAHLYGAGLDGSTVGIAGMGAVGRAIARRLRGFGPRIIYADPHPLDATEAQSLDARRVTWDVMLASSDFLLLAIPLIAETFHRIDSDAIARIKPGCRLINAGRGSVVDENAVAAALAEGRLGGYAADVFEMEDWTRVDRPLGIPAGLLADRARTVFTPHLGSAVDGIRREIAMMAARDIVSVLGGGTPAYAVNRLFSR